MPSAKTSTVLGLVRHATTLRLTRIATLVVGSLVFLYACEASRKSDLSDVWIQVAIAAGLAMTGLTTAWFEVRAAGHAATRARTEIRGFLIESEDLSVRARITRSGDLVFHGHDSGGTDAAYEWDWAFRATTFPAIRAALGGKGDLLDLLERTVPHLDRQDRYDPGAWLHDQGIPAAFRERGDSSTRITRVLPVIKPEAELAHHDPDAPPSRESTGAQEHVSARHNAAPHRRTPAAADENRPERSRRRHEPSPEQGGRARGRRRAPADPHRPEPSADSRDERQAARHGEPPTRRRNQPQETHRATPPSEHRSARPGERWDEPINDDWDEPSNTGWNEPPNDRRSAPPSDTWNAPPSDSWDAPPNERGNEPPAATRPTPPARRRDDSSRHRSTETPSGHWPEATDQRYRNPAPRPYDEGSGAHRPALSGAHHTENPWPHQSAPQNQRWNDPPETGRRW
ncbi:hypothetical protein ACQP1G_11340 [Nocardia sp. CA-107356]|uniref:hypothetical protein n=1 Tax=Nocardia sp. CA-107356 TaxID=3239972 RepID=UPI003D94CE1C